MSATTETIITYMGPGRNVSNIFTRTLPAVTFSNPLDVRPVCEENSLVEIQQHVKSRFGDQDWTLSYNIDDERVVLEDGSLGSSNFLRLLISIADGDFRVFQASAREIGVLQVNVEPAVSITVQFTIIEIKAQVALGCFIGRGQGSSPTAVGRRYARGSDDPSLVSFIFIRRNYLQRFYSDILISDGRKTPVFLRKFTLFIAIYSVDLFL
jgi:hypothetical protein